MAVSVVQYTTGCCDGLGLWDTRGSVPTSPRGFQALLFQPRRPAHLDSTLEKDIDPVALHKVGRFLDPEPDAADTRLDKLGRTARPARSPDRAWLHRRVAVDVGEDLVRRREVTALGGRVELEQARLQIGQGVGFSVRVSWDLARVPVREDQAGR